MNTIKPNFKARRSRIIVAWLQALFCALLYLNASLVTTLLTAPISAAYAQEGGSDGADGAGGTDGAAPGGDEEGGDGGGDSGDGDGSDGSDGDDGGYGGDDGDDGYGGDYGGGYGADEGGYGYGADDGFDAMGGFDSMDSWGGFDGFDGFDSVDNFAGLDNQGLMGPPSPADAQTALDAAAEALSQYASTDYGPGVNVAQLGPVAVPGTFPGPFATPNPTNPSNPNPYNNPEMPQASTPAQQFDDWMGSIIDVIDDFFSGIVNSEPASEKEAQDISKQIERDLGKDAARDFHDMKDPGEPDRSKEQLREDARDIYNDYGKEPPSWLR